MAGPELDDVTRTFERAERCIVEERRQLVDEREAFRAFEDRVRRIEPVVSATASAPAAATAVATPSTAGKLDAVRDAYRATVMSVPHYDEAYDDTYGRSVTEEFGTGVGAALTEGVAFTGRCKRGVLSAARSCRREREQFLSVVEAEHDSLESAAEVLVPVASQLAEFDELPFADEPPEALDAYRTRLDVLEERCEEAAATRQAVVDDHRDEFVPESAPDVAVYLYRELAVTYPALSMAAGIADRVDDVRLDLWRAIDGLVEA